NRKNDLNSGIAKMSKVAMKQTRGGGPATLTIGGSATLTVGGSSVMEFDDVALDESNGTLSFSSKKSVSRR
ncbi:MAG: hypothetical protein QF645_09105, partial [Planctomycetota bacterium]|nr:hypothetical protein [Planctomycetota bacterium]